MAISWTCDITNVNVMSNRADVTFTRTDDETSATWSKKYRQALLETQEQRVALLDTVWAEWEDELADRNEDNVFIDNLEQAAKSNLDAREV